MILRNSFAHLLARVLSLLAGLIAIPLVAVVLGSEALGLAGVYLTLQGLFSLFDVGLSAAVSQQLAVWTSRKRSALHRAELVRSLEILFWLMAVLFCGIGLLTKGTLATSWLKVAGLEPSLVDHALTLIVTAAAIRFPIAFYANVQFGLDRHIYPNLVVAGAALARIVVPVVALTQFSTGIAGYFSILLVLNALEVVLMMVGAWREVGTIHVRPRWARLQEIGHATGLLGLASLAAVAMTQIDKVILSAQLSLADFGVYAAAYAIAGGLIALSYPVGNAVFPKLVEQWDRRDDAAARTTVLLGAQLTIALLVPIGATVMLHSSAVTDLLFVFRAVPEGLPSILPLMIAGALAQGFVTLPHIFQLAALRTKYVVWLNMALLVPYAAMVYFAARHAGVWGAAGVFAALNILHLAAHWILLRSNDRSAPLWRSVPLLVSGSVVVGLAVAGTAAAVQPPAPLNVLAAGASFIVLLIVAVASLPDLRIAAARLAIARTRRM